MNVATFPNQNDEQIFLARFGFCFYIKKFIVLSHHFLSYTEPK
jgi:hypothetical protein